MATCSIATLIDEACASGFKCLDEQTFRGVLLQLLCNYQAAAVGQQVFGGAGEPNITPTVDYAIWINTTDDTQRVWHTSAWH